MFIIIIIQYDVSIILIILIKLHKTMPLCYSLSVTLCSLTWNLCAFSLKTSYQCVILVEFLLVSINNLMFNFKVSENVYV